MKKQILRDSAELVFTRPINEAEEGGEQTGGHWSAKVWTLDKKNLNGRIYPKALAERIVREHAVTTANDGHGADFEQEFGAAKATCFNPRIEDNCLVVDIKFLESEQEYQARLEELMKSGVKIGVSSCGWGECNRDGLVDADTYELIRFLDFVACPANETYLQKNKESRNEPDPEPSVEGKKEASMDVAASLAKIFLGGK